MSSFLAVPVIDVAHWRPMNDAIWLTCDKKSAESQFSPTHASTKKITKKTKTKHWAVGSPWWQSGWSPVCSPVRWVETEDLWWIVGKDLWNRCEQAELSLLLTSSSHFTWKETFHDIMTSWRNWSHHGHHRTAGIRYRADFFPREAFPGDGAQGYVSALSDSRAETYPCASSRGKDRRVIGPQPHRSLFWYESFYDSANSWFMIIYVTLAV